MLFRSGRFGRRPSESLFGGDGIDTLFGDFDLHAFADFEHDAAGVLIDALHGAVDAGDGDDLLSDGERVAEVHQFFLFLVLRTNHEEVEDGEENDHHHNHGDVAAGGCGLCLEKSCEHVSLVVCENKNCFVFSGKEGAWCVESSSTGFQSNRRLDSPWSSG